VVSRAEDFGAALQEMTASVSRRNDVVCEVDCPQPVSIDVREVAVHLYRIAAEAVANAVRHAQARRIVLHVAVEDDMLVLEVRDDGVGIPPDAGTEGSGLGIMRHRANVIGATLDVRRGAEGGTIVLCTVPVERLRRPGRGEA
jgi:signal transduction histidine kinase